jgi:hypothetical protein
VSWTMRHRLTLLLTCSMPTRRRAMRRFAASCARVKARPLGFLVGMIISTCSSVNAKKPRSWSNRLPAGLGIRGRLGNPLIVGAARIGRTQKEDGKRGIDQQHVFHIMALFPAAITARLLSRILGAPDAPFGAIMANRGEAGGSAGVGGPSGGTTTAAASASVTPMC